MGRVAAWSMHVIPLQIGWVTPTSNKGEVGRKCIFLNDGVVVLNIVLRRVTYTQDRAWQG